MSSKSFRLLVPILAFAAIAAIAACVDRPADPPGAVSAAAIAPPPDTAAQSAVEVLRRYFAAIDARDYPTAYALWANGGAASGQTLEEFAAGFAQTERVRAEIGEPGRIEGAAGSRYIAIPVAIHATTASGEEQHFEGGYTLRRSVGDGATPEQRSWRIHSAALRRR